MVSFTAFNIDMYSLYGDFGEGFYSYCQEYIAYGLRIGSYVMEFDIIKVGECAVIKKSALPKLIFKSAKKIVDLTDFDGTSFLIELEDGTILSTDKY